MTIDQLRYFHAVCKYGGVNQAAGILNISQPSVSNAIANLEKEFHVKLFVRYHKRLQLTEEGHILLESAGKLLSQAEEITQTMQDLSNKNNALRLGVPPMIGSMVLPIVYGEYRKLHPQLCFHIVEDDTSGLKKLLADNQIDIAFLPHTRPFEDDLCTQHLTTLQNVCCVSKSHPLAGRKSIQFEELRNEPLVLFKNSFFQTERILDEFARRAITPFVLMNSSQLSTVQNMIAHSSAIGFMFEFLLKSTPDLVGIPLDPPMTTQVSLVWKKTTHFSADMNNLIQFLKSKYDS